MNKIKQIAQQIAHKIPVVKNRIGCEDTVRSQMERMARSRPFDIALETYSRCNSRCVFCAYRKVRRKKELMSMELFEKICNEYVDMGGGSFGFAPLLADPLLDPYLMDRMRLARKWHPAIRMYFFTNAIQFGRFSDEDILYILDSIEGMNISLSVLSRDDYKKMFQVNKYDAVMNTMDRINRLIKKVDFPPDIVLHIRTSQKEATLGSEPYKKLVDMGFDCGDVADIFSNWGGIIEKEELPDGTRLLSPDNGQAEIACLIPMISLTITADGNVLACGCFDAEMEHVVGNVGTETLEEIWQGEKLKLFRESFERRRIAQICRTCAHYTPYRDIFSQSAFAGFRPEIHSFWSSLHYQRPYSHGIIHKKDFRYF